MDLDALAEKIKNEIVKDARELLREFRTETNNQQFDGYRIAIEL
ncbi:MAG: hypothetical protein PWQ22_1012 [Archaeoglobaceae archaeon]|nr:hypothetical protein [Archaeoglobaceae archaeon]MDK2876602.1 hypothetical protein [Archaeoglobaceae archaeon]